MPDTGQPRVLIYRNDLLEQSETFIAAQSGALRRYSPVYCGLQKRANGILSTDATSAVLGEEAGLAAKLRRLIYLQTGYAPEWRRVVEQQQALLMHAHFALDATCALPLLTRLQIPLVVTLHGYDVTNTDEVFRESRGGRLYLRRRQQLFERADTFVCVSEFIRQMALRAGFPEQKLWVHSIGINLEDFHPAKINDSTEMGEGPLVLFVGRLVEKKGCIYLLQAMRLVQQSHPSARLVVIGDGTLRPELERTARELALTGCEFLGARPQSVIREWLHKANVFSVPSIIASNGDAEGLGMVFCEAQAMGVPVASFASGGIPEAVATGRSGFLVQEKDERALAQAILSLLDNESLWRRMSDHGRQRMIEKFDLHRQTALLEEMYDKVLEQSPFRQDLKTRSGFRYERNHLTA